MSVSDANVSTSEIDQFIERCGDREYVKATFLAALRSIRKNGKSKVPLLLDEANINAHKIGKDKFQSLISAVFEIADDIFRNEDREHGDSIGDNHVRIHWLIRKLTFERCDVEERSKILMEACETAQIGWLVDFVSSAFLDYYPGEGREPEPKEKCLVKKDCIPGLKELVVKTIAKAAADGTLSRHCQLAYMLFQWGRFVDDDQRAVKTGTGRQMKSDE